MSEAKEETTVDNSQITLPEEVTVICKEPVNKCTFAEIVAQTYAEEKSNETSLLVDESIISIEDSPNVNLTAPPKDATFSPAVDKSMPDSRPIVDFAILSPVGEKTVKDNTFSPVVDTSIHDSRPHIDVNDVDMETNFNTTPLHRNITHRTSTPLAQKIMKRDTPKPGTSALVKFAMSQGEISNGQYVESLSETSNGQFKVVNQFEKSILKSTRKRSFSVADMDSFVQKKVVFVSPTFMNIGEIDEKMMQSFRDEKETSILKAQKASGTRRKRSMSASDTPVRPVKVKTPARKAIPDFKAIHEKRFRKMESIDEHAMRKANRAKKLVTPSKSLPIAPEIALLPTVFEKSSQKQGIASKIPIVNRKPLVKLPQPSVTEQPQIKRNLKRSMSAEPQHSSSQPKKIAFVSGIQRSMSQDKFKMKGPSTTTAASTSQASTSQALEMRGKLEERRERNMSLYKTNVSKARGNTAEVRKKNENILKGVRLNRRFELQMKHRGEMEHINDN